MEISLLQSLKMIAVTISGLSKDALHVHVGLAAMVVAILLLRRPLGSWVPWLAALVVACAGELWDMRDDFASLGRWRWSASLRDVLNTLFWPTILLLLARLGRLNKGGQKRR